MSTSDLLALAVDPEILRLEQMLSGFNIFEALGITRNEIRHSSFLAYLLDPLSKHGAEDHFLRAFLSHVASCEESPNSAIIDRHIEDFQTNDVTVRREFKNIDICISSHNSQTVVIIENKIGSKEHSDQLQRYMDIARVEFPNYRRIGIYLTPDGDLPSSGDYTSVSYKSIVQSLEQVLESKGDELDISVHILVTHYLQMVRRHIVSNSEVSRLSRELYARHRSAIESIIQNKPSLKQL